MGLWNRWDFSGLLTDGVNKKGPLPRIRHTYPTVIKTGTVTPYLKGFKWYLNHVTHPFTSADISICHRKSPVSLYQETQIKIVFWYVISNSFNLFRIFKDCFNKHGYNFDDASKNGYSRFSWNKGILKLKLWNPNFCHDVTNKILSHYKLYCWCDHVTKVWQLEHFYHGT